MADELNSKSSVRKDVRVQVPHSVFARGSIFSTASPRSAVIFSPYDLSCALERHELLECPGYIREDAARIGINIVLYGLH
jgi:hypothetical protein